MGAEVRKLADQGQLRVAGRRWEISRALAGEWVKLVRLEQRILVYYCRSLVRELDLSHQRSHGRGPLVGDKFRLGRSC
jgi:hypothetical protein